MKIGHSSFHVLVGKSCFKNKSVLSFNRFVVFLSKARSQKIANRYS